MPSSYDPMNQAWKNRSVRWYDDLTTNPLTWIVAAVVVLALVVLGGWEIGWWFKQQNVNRTTQVIRGSLGYQSNLQSEIQGLFGNVQQIGAQIQSPSVQGSEVGALKAERYADLSQLCGYAAQAQDGTLDGQQESFVAANCLNGAVSPSSQFAQQ